MRATATAIVCVRARVCVCCVRVCQGFHCKHNMMYTMPTSLSLSLLLSPLSLSPIRALPTSLQSSLKSCIYANYIIFYYNFLTRTPQKAQQLAKLCQLSNFRFELALPFTLSPSLSMSGGSKKHQAAGNSRLSFCTVSGFVRSFRAASAWQAIVSRRQLSCHSVYSVYWTLWLFVNKCAQIELLFGYVIKFKISKRRKKEKHPLYLRLSLSLDLPQWNKSAKYFSIRKQTVKEKQKQIRKKQKTQLFWAKEKKKLSWAGSSCWVWPGQRVK